MTKADIVERIQLAIGGKKKEAADLVETVFSIMKTTLEMANFQEIICRIF